MTRSKQALILTAFASLAGCGDLKRPTDTPQAAVETAITSFVAESCAGVCRFVSITIEVRNPTSEAICIPSLYQGEGIAGATTIVYASGKGAVELTQPYDPNVFLSRNYREDMAVLAEGPQLVVQPGASRRIVAVLEQQFDLVSKSARGSVRFSYFPCQFASDGGVNMTIKDLSHEVTFGVSTTTN